MDMIQTPYGKKTPELLCKAMDALELVEKQREQIKILREAVRRTVRWVGKGIADGGFNCVSPQQAERDMLFAEEAFKATE